MILSQLENVPTLTQLIHPGGSVPQLDPLLQAVVCSQVSHWKSNQKSLLNRFNSESSFLQFCTSRHKMRAGIFFVAKKTRLSRQELRENAQLSFGEALNLVQLRPNGSKGEESSLPMVVNIPANPKVDVFETATATIFKS